MYTIITSFAIKLLHSIEYLTTNRSKYTLSKLPVVMDMFKHFNCTKAPKQRKHYHVSLEKKVAKAFIKSFKPHETGAEETPSQLCQ